MKLLLFTLLSALLLASAKAEDDLALPQRCEDVLTAEQCQKLYDFATRVQVKIADLDRKISAAVQDGLTQAKDIYVRARADLVAQLQSKTCEDLLPAEHCAKLRDLAATLKEKASDLDSRIRQAVAQGKVRASEIYQQVRAKYNEVLAIRTCEDILSAEQCAKIRNAAASAKALPAQVNQAVRDAVARGKARANEIYQEALNFFRTRVMSKTCEDVISAEACAKLRNMAAVLKEKAELVDEYVRRAMLEGQTEAAKILKQVEDYFKSLANAKTCDDVLPGEFCDKFRNIAATLKEEANDVEERIREAVAQGKGKASEIYQQVKAKYEALLAIRTCEDVLSAEQCTKIRNAAASVKALPAQVNQAVRDAAARGKARAEEIYQEALDFFRTQVLSKTCEDVISAQACAKLRNMAAGLKEKAQLVDEYVRRAMLEGKTEAAKILKRVEDYFNSLANAKTCDDLLPGETCDKLRELSEKLRMNAEKASQAVRDAVQRGYTKVTDVTTNAIENVKNFAQNAQCEDVLPADACAKLRQTADKVKVGAAKVNEAVKDAVAKSIFFGKDVMARAEEFIKENISCEKVLGAATCEKVRSIATKVGVALDEVDRVIKEKVMEGMDQLSEVYDAVLRFIKDHIWGKLKSWVPSLGKRSLEKRALSGLVEKAKAKAREAIEKAKALLAKARAEAMKALEAAKGKTKEIVAEAIRQGKEKLSQLEALLKELMEKYGPTGDELKMAKRGFVESLKEKIREAKAAIEKIFQRVTAGLQRVSYSLDEPMRPVFALFDEPQKKELEDDFSIMTNILDDVAKRTTEEMAAKVIESSSALLDEAFEDIEDLADDIDDHSYSKKREADSDLFMRLDTAMDVLAANL